MPLLKIETNAALSEDARKSLPAALSKAGAEILGKPEQYFLVSIHPAEMLMSGKPGPAAFADLRSIGGLGGDVNRRLAQRICSVLKEALGIPPDRIYLNFTDVKAADWGWNGNTFG